MKPFQRRASRGADQVKLSPREETARGTRAGLPVRGLPDDAVLLAARDGDRDAISQLFRMLQPKLLRVLRIEVGDAADDVASQTWLEVIGALKRFEGDLEGFRALLFTIARRRVADHRRTQRRRPSLATEPATLVDAVEAPEDVATAVLDVAGSAWAIQRITELLPRDQAEVVLLRVVADLPVEQVAAILGRAPGTIRVQQHRALKRLAAALSGNDNDAAGDRDKR